MTEHTQIPTADGPMSALIVQPDGPPKGAVVVIMEAFGVNDHMADVASRFAAAGYVAVAPDLYHRAGTMQSAGYDDMQAAMALFGAVTTAQLAGDLVAAVDAARELAPEGPVAVVGFCLGGYSAVLAAIRATPDVVAGFYGAGISIQREGSPLLPLAGEFDAIDCPVHLFYGAEDPVIPPAEIDATRAALTDAGVEHTISVYPNAGHGFFCDARAAYVADAATDAWPKVLAAIAAATPERAA